MKKSANVAGALLAQFEPVDETDGRIKRSKDSQQRIVGAMLELVAEGHMTPSAEQVAERAGLGLCSVFRHFKDMDTLYREMTDALATTIEDVVRQPFKAKEWHGRVLELVDRRATVFERLAPYHRAAQVHRQRSAVLRLGHERFVKTLREILMALLPATIAGQMQLVEAMDLLLSFEAWHRLREDQGLEVAKARRVLKGTISSLLHEDMHDD